MTGLRRARLSCNGSPPLVPNSPQATFLYRVQRLNLDKHRTHVPRAAQGSQSRSSKYPAHRVRAQPCQTTSTDQTLRCPSAQARPRFVRRRLSQRFAGVYGSCRFTMTKVPPPLRLLVAQRLLRNACRGNLRPASVTPPLHLLSLARRIRDLARAQVPPHLVLAATGWGTTVPYVHCMHTSHRTHAIHSTPKLPQWRTRSRTGCSSSALTRRSRGTLLHRKTATR